MAAAGETTRGLVLLSWRFTRLFEQGLYLGNEEGKVTFSHASHRGVVDGVVAMDDSIAEGDDAMELADSRRDGRIG